jgi:hypothetical protein
MTNFYRDILSAAKNIQSEVDEHLLPPKEVTASLKDTVLPHSLFRQTRGYIEKIVYQINITYDKTCYDACAVMIRRLIETLIIESFENHNIENKIMNSSGNFVELYKLIDKTLLESTWNLSRNTKRGLKKLKKLGDRSAHSRRFNAQRTDIDKLIDDLRIVAEELLYISGLKK